MVTSSIGSNPTLGSVADDAFHAMQGGSNGGTLSVIAVGGTETTGNAAAGSPSGVAMRICRYAAANSLDGTMMEAGFWPAQSRIG
jgi:hypothetical protein